VGSRLLPLGDRFWRQYRWGSDPVNAQVTKRPISSPMHCAATTTSVATTRCSATTGSSGAFLQGGDHPAQDGEDHGPPPDGDHDGGVESEREHRHEERRRHAQLGEEGRRGRPPHLGRGVDSDRASATAIVRMPPTTAVRDSVPADEPTSRPSVVMTPEVSPKVTPARTDVDSLTDGGGPRCRGRDGRPPPGCHRAGTTRSRSPTRPRARSPRRGWPPPGGRRPG
jgi:hypothetical protein